MIAGYGAAPLAAELGKPDYLAGIPLEACFRSHASKDGELELARYFAIETAAGRRGHVSIRRVFCLPVIIVAG